MAKRSIFGIFFIAVLIISGCQLESPQAPEGGNSNPMAFIDGRIQDSDGEPLHDVTIDITTFDTTCDEEGVNHGTVTTDIEGEFLTSLVRSEEITINCITLRTSSKTQTQLQDSTISRSADLEFKKSEPYDTEVMNITY